MDTDTENSGNCYEQGKAKRSLHELFRAVSEPIRAYPWFPHRRFPCRRGESSVSMKGKPQ